MFDGIIIGGGITGISAALALSGKGLSACLVEQGAAIGGRAGTYGCKASDACNKCYACLVRKKIDLAAQAPHISIITKAALTALSGQSGAFKAVVQSVQGFQEIPAKQIVVASGFAPFAAETKGQFGYGRLTNVLTGKEAEEQLRNHGAIRCPSDTQPAKQLAFIQCVGSRDRKIGNTYCSRVCCAYALRMADFITHRSDTQVTIFYMDIQSFGKDFDAFYQKCLENKKMVFTQGIPGQIQAGENGTLNIKYEKVPGGTIEHGVFDAVVLSVGITADPGNKALAGMLGISLDQYGFFKSDSVLEPYKTEKAGIYIAGTCRQPMNIGHAIAEGEGVGQYFN